MRKQRGVALIQVIIITSIILLLTIFFLSVAKSQVARAAALQAKSLAYMAQYSGKNRVLFGLLTKDSMQLREQGWNFYGQAFSINEHTKVQLLPPTLCKALRLGVSSQSTRSRRAALAPTFGKS